MMKYFEMFTGIAGFSKGIEQAYESIESAKFSGQELRRGGRGDSCESGFGQQQHSCIGFSEIASVPCGILKYHYPDIRNYGNAAELVCDELPDFDFLCGGFPCQSFSIAGKRGGFEDARGTLFFEIARVLKAKRPLYALLENVKGLVSHDGGRTLEIILETLQEIGYFVDWEIHNSKHYGVPQNRERIFFICYSTDLIRDGHQTMTQPCVEIIKQWMFQALQNRWAGAVRRQGAVSKDWVLGFAILEESVAALGPAMKCESLKLIWRNLFGNYNPSYQGDLFKESSIKPVHWEDPKSIVAGILTAMAENRLQSAAVDPWQSIDLLLRSVWEENSPDKKPFTTSTSIKHITQP